MSGMRPTKTPDLRTLSRPRTYSTSTVSGAA